MRKFITFAKSVVFALPFFALLLHCKLVAAGEDLSWGGSVLQEEQATSLDRTIVTKGQNGSGSPQRDNFGRRKIRVGLYENDPKIFTDQSGFAAGIFPEILDEIAQKEEWQLTYVPCKWAECLEALEKGRLDLLPDVAYSQERNKSYDFHQEEVISSWSAVFVKNRKDMNSIFDLNNKRIGVLSGSIQQKFLDRMAKGLGFTISFVEAVSFKEVFNLLTEGSADAVVVNHFFGDYFHRQYGFKKTPIVFNPVSLFFATTKGANPDLLTTIDRNLLAMKSESDSNYYKALVHWMEEPPRLIIPKYIVWIVISISGLLSVSLIFILLLRWQVRAGILKLAESNEMLHKSEKKFRDLFDKHAAIKLLIDPDNGNIIAANKAAEKFYGWPIEHLQRMQIQDISTLDYDKAMAQIEKARSHERIDVELSHRLADGSVRDVAVFTSMIEVEGKKLLHSIIHDITERRKIEEQLQQIQKMESVGRLAGGVAHDFNNMLSVIIGNTEMVMDNIEKTDPIQPVIDDILLAAKRSVGITRQLLAFARQQTIAPKVIDLNKTVENLLKILRRLAGEDIFLEWHPGSELWHVKIDPAQIDQILANLCINARDAITDVGKIIIETANFTFDENYCADYPELKPGDYVQLVISDNGSGMTPDIRDNAFEPFYTTKKKDQGTGLGLSTVYGIVKQNNGYINLYSEPQQGTTVKIYLSRHEGETVTVAEESKAAIPSGQGETVLLVEDEKAFLQFGSRLLESLGYKVLVAETPGDAIDLVQNFKGEIHLLITDVVLPEMNGRDMAAHLKVPYPDLKIIFMSGHMADIIAEKGVLVEGVNFIKKPFTKRDLAVKIRAVLEDDDS